MVKRNSRRRGCSAVTGHRTGIQGTEEGGLVKQSRRLQRNLQRGKECVCLVEGQRGLQGKGLAFGACSAYCVLEGQVWGQGCAERPGAAARGREALDCFRFSARGVWTVGCRWAVGWSRACALVNPGRHPAHDVGLSVGGSHRRILAILAILAAAPRPMLSDTTAGPELCGRFFGVSRVRPPPLQAHPQETQRHPHIRHAHTPTSRLSVVVHGFRAGSSFCLPPLLPG